MREGFFVGGPIKGRAKLPLSREVGTRIHPTARREPRPPGFFAFVAWALARANFSTQESGS